MQLTTKAIDAIAADKQREIADDGCSGLYLVALPSGTKSWAYRYRNRAGRQCRIPLGLYNAGREADRVSLKRARELADAMRAKVRDGVDPVAERAAERAKARAEAEAATLEAERVAKGEAVAADPFKRVWAKFEREYLPDLRPNTVGKWKGIYRRVLSRWDGKPLNEITDADVIAVRDDLKKSSADAADSALALISVFFSWCADVRLIAPKDSPCIGIKKVKRPKGKEQVNPESDRILSADEIRWLWQATSDTSDTFAAMVRLLLLTGARRAEASDMKRTELDLFDNEWRIPPDRYKTGKTHTVFLSDAAVSLLKSIPKVDKSPFVFAIRGGGAINGFSKRKARLDKRMAEIASAERGEPVTLRPWRLHGLRKTFRTGLTETLKIPEHIAKRCTGHSIGGIDATYDKGEYIEERRAAFKAWSDYVEAVAAAAPASNVVPLRRA